MPKFKLTLAGVKKLKAPDPSGKQFVYQSGQSGLAIIVSATTTDRKWTVQGQLNQKAKRIVLGDVLPGCDQDEINRQLCVAQQYREDMLRSIDPREAEKREEVQRAVVDVTFG